ncbi:pentatricopeptide repeat-containing protein At4g02750-like [Cucurbita pepo subsp. pepo]|uniref:pentatricopeptide repeat-containing protein At4g02750-like n=1 Tax=Cucurbita pepo subsp. pepo TaxID=3664 RepID=UPI000C9D2D6C|nr:pentatricopeptide repeat-containing protein At4g02750-like [Cucurbita pepo subsp. pepo]
MKAKSKLRQAVDLLCSRSTATSEAYTQLVLECVRANEIDQAKRLQSHMEHHLFQPPDPFLHNQLLHLYAKFGKLRDAQNLFDKMLERDVFSWNALLSAYAKSGSIPDLRATFDRMPYRDSVSYNTIIAGLSGNSFPKESLELFRRMQREGLAPTEYTNVSALNASAQLLDLRRGKQIHGSVIVHNYLGNVFICNALTDMYAKCGEIEQARWLFDRLTNKNLVSWNLMISGYVKNGQPEKCIGLLHEMRLSGHMPDQVTLSTVIAAYCQCGRGDEARRVFNEFKDKDIVCWTAMLVGYAKSGREEDALLLFNEMLLEHFEPDSYTLSSVVSSCAKLASLCHGQAIHGKSILAGLDNNLLVSSALIDMYSKCGLIEDARSVFDVMPTRNVITWNAMIVGYAQNGRDKDTLELFENMLQEKFKPDNVTFVGVLSACLHSNLIEQGQMFFDSISNQHGLTPSSDHYACMVNLLGRSGRIDQAVNLIKNMPHEPDFLIWSTLLSVSATKGDVARAEMAGRHLFELDPTNAVPYIMLSNMYASMGRWKDVAAVRSVMKNKNVKKFAGYSWIEIDNEVHKFTSEDRTHPETEQIYEELKILIRKLQEQGFRPNTNLVLHDVGEEEKLKSICFHSEKLALVFGLIKKGNGVSPIRIIKNIRICSDCHEFMKFASMSIRRQIILRDSNRFHHFSNGKCSCKDNW